MPKASVILPVWNNEQDIGNAIKSIKEQTCKEIECLVVDDGSTDASMHEAMQAIDHDKRFKLIQQRHMGLSCARNAGIDASSSDIVFYIDADDAALPQMVEAASSFLETNDLDMAIYDAKVIPNKTTDIVMTSERKYFARKKNYGIGKGKELLNEMISSNDFVYAVFVQATRKSSIKERFCPSLRAQDELYTVENMMLMERVGHLSEVLYVKGCRQASVSHQRHDAHYVWSRLKALMELVRFIERNKLTADAAIVAPIITRLKSSIINSFSQFINADLQWIESLPLEDRTLLELAYQSFKKWPVFKI